MSSEHAIGCLHAEVIVRLQKVSASETKKCCQKPHLKFEAMRVKYITCQTKPLLALGDLFHQCLHFEIAKSQVGVYFIRGRFKKWSTPVPTGVCERILVKKQGGWMDGRIHWTWFGSRMWKLVAGMDDSWKWWPLKEC